MDLSTYPPLLTTQSDNEVIKWHLQEHLIAESRITNLEFSEFTIIEFDSRKQGDAEEALQTNSDQQNVLPVYRSDEGALGVPSGLIYIRVSPELSVESFAEQLLELGFKINKTSLIPYVGWLESADSDFATTLLSIDSLAKLPGMVLFEPQLLMEQRTR